MKTLAGRLSRPKQTTRAMEYHPGPTRIMTLDRRRTPLSAIHTGTSRATPATSSPRGGTFRSSVRPGTLRTLSPTTM